jgi:formylglycine-generating enzyme required for sulfatase activity
MDPYQCDGYRLPTEVEWEYMSRAVYPSPTSNRTQWPSKGFWTDDGIGNIPVGQKDNCTDSNWVFVQGTTTAASLVQSSYTLDDYAWYCANSFDGVKYNTHDVMQKLPNAFELYDLHGNVGEWCHDYIELLLADPNLPKQTDMLGSIVSTYRSSKGGSVMDPPRVLRDAAEGARPHIARNPGVGIRLVRIANP